MSYGAFVFLSFQRPEQDNTPKTLTLELQGHIFASSENDGLRVKTLILLCIVIFFGVQGPAIRGQFGQMSPRTHKQRRGDMGYEVGCFRWEGGGYSWEYCRQI